jgi:Yip1 domain
MVLNHVWGLLTNPTREWKAVRKERAGIFRSYWSHFVILAAIPAVAGYYGTTRVGWHVIAREVHRLTPESALPMAIATYVTLLVAVFVVGMLIHWMERTYGAKADLDAAVALAGHTATPLFLVGVSLLYPLLWVNLLLGLPALAYSVYLLYSGVPVITGISKERGFLFASAVLAVGLVMFIGVLAATVILWSAGVGPVVEAG